IQKAAQADGFFCQLPTDHRVRLSRAVSFREEQVVDLEHRRKSSREVFDAGWIELLGALPECRPSPLQALVDRLLGVEQPQSDLLCAETTENLQSQHELRLARDRGIGTDEQHP